MEYFFELLLSGLTRGSIYALIALGYTMVYGIIQLISADCVADDNPNFALGDESEDSLAAALSFIETGSCPVVPSPKAAAILGMQQTFKDQIRRLKPGRLERNFD